MDPVVIIGTRSEGVTVLDVERLPHEEGEQVLVEISRGGLTAARWVFFFHDAPELARYFSSLSRHWRGWQGTREWKSLEGDLEIHATHTGSHVDFVVSLRSEPSWRSKISLTVAAGTDLERIADVVATTLPT
jgi:hypothetical protein